MDKYRDRLQEILDGKDTFLSIRAEVDRNKNNLEAVFKLGRKYEIMRKRENAGELYKTILDNPETAKNTMVPLINGEDWEKINAFEMSKFLFARLKIYKRDYSGFKDFVKEFPHGKLAEDAYRYLASYYAYQADPEEAKPFFAQMVENYPKNTELLYYYVNFSNRQEIDMEKAVKAGNEIYNAVVEPNYYRMLSYSRLLDKYGDEDLIEEKYGKDYIERLTTSYTYNLAYYANFWADKEKNLKDALKSAKSAVDINPERSYFRWIAAKVYAKMDNIAEAKKIFGSDYIETRLDEPNDLYYYINFWAEQKDNLESALEIAKFYAGSSPNDARRTMYVAKVLMATGNKAEALKIYGPEFIRNHMKSYSVLYTYAGFWAENETNLESALETAKKSIELRPISYNNSVLGLIYWKMKMYTEAIEATEKAIKLSSIRMPEYEERIEQIKAETKK